MEWNTERRIETARAIAAILREESRGIIMSGRAFELSELILFVLTMPASVLNANRDKYQEFCAF